MRLRQNLAAIGLAAVGAFALAGCTGSLNDADVDPNFEPVAQDTAPDSPSTLDQPEDPDLGVPETDTEYSTEFVASCLEYGDFNYEFEQQLADGLSGDFIESDEDLEVLRETMQEASESFDEVVEDSNDDEFIADAENVRPMFDVFEEITAPDLSDQERLQLIEEMDANPGFEAEEDLVQKCDEAVSGQ